MLREAYAATGLLASPARLKEVTDYAFYDGLCRKAMLWIGVGEGDPRSIDSQDLAWLSRWASCKHVYRIDAEVARELRAQPLDGAIPAQVLLRLPYPIVYVEPGADCYGVGDPAPASLGFLAYVDDTGEEPFLSLVAVFPDGRRRASYLPLDADRTLGDLADLTVRLARDVLGADVDPDEAASESRLLAQMANLLLYVITEEEDAEVAYAPPTGGRGQRPGRSTNPETVHALGVRIGRAIGEARRRSGGDGGAGPSARTVAPHVRRAHWAHYWTGPRKGRTDGRYGDELVVRWIPPVAVNADEGDVPEEVVHVGRREGR